MPDCPEGHVTTANDCCDVCGAAMSVSAAQAITSNQCSSCATPVADRFCEVCGHDSALPTPSPTSGETAVEWTAVVTADRDYYKRVTARGGPDTVEFPEYFPDRRIALRGNMVIGRTNRRKDVEPAIDLGVHPADHGVSARHAVLRANGTGLTVTDLGSTNGTSLNDSDERLPYGEEIVLADGDRIHVGAWTTITVAQSPRRSR